MAGGQGVGAAVIPGLGTVNAGHVGATVGLLNGVVSHAFGEYHPTGDVEHQQIATWAQQDPARYGADLLLHGHNRRRYDELARARRLPSEVWAQHEATGQLDGHLRTIHERDGEQLRQLYRHRPMGERAILGFAAASGTSEDVARALDALRAHPCYPARVSFPRLVHGFSPSEIARLASAFLPGMGGSEGVVEVYRAVHDERAQARRERRRRLFRQLREQWASERPGIIPLFEGITREFSPAQAERLRLELERRGNAETVFEDIEKENLRRRLHAMEAAFRRWLAEWEGSHHPSVQTPLQESHVVLDSILPPRADLPEIAVVPVVEPAAEVDAEADLTPDSDRQLVLQRGLRDVEAPGDQDADGVRAAAKDGDALENEAGALYALRAPPPGAHAADGVLPWGHLMQGFGRHGKERLRRAWDGGRQWGTYQEVFAQRSAHTMAVREAEFLRCLQGLGCRLPGPCRIERERLAALAPLGSGFTPEQWARLGAALTEGTLDPLEAWRDIERENAAEAVSVREPAFIHYVGAWGRTPRANPVEWARTAPRLRRLLLDEEASGLLDDEGGDVGDVDADNDSEGPSDADQGIGSLFGGSASGAQGTIGALGGDLRGFAEQALGTLTGRSSQIRSGASPTRALDEAAGLLGVTEGPLAGGVDDVLSTVDKTVGSLLAGGNEAPRPPSVGAVAGRVGGFAEQASLDLQRVLALWGGPQRKLGEQAVRALSGVGLTELATTPPNDLLRIVAGHTPSGSDPSGWWGELTAGQGLSESAEQELRRAIDTDGPKGIARTVATYVRLLQDATDAQKVLRDAIFTAVHDAAQHGAGPAFDPARLPGGDPFVLLSEHTGDWSRVAEAMKSGKGVLEVFRQVEDGRQDRLLRGDAPAWMSRMLTALWEQRQKAGWVPGSPGAGADEAGAVDHTFSGHSPVTPSGRVASTVSVHTGSVPAGGQGSPLSSHPSYTTSGHAGQTASVHPTYARADHPAYALLGHTGSTPPGYAGNAPSVPAGNMPSGHQGNAQPGHPAYPPPALPGSTPPAHHPFSPPPLPGNTPAGHQGYAPPGHPGNAPPAQPWNTPAGHQGTGGHGSFTPPGLPWNTSSGHHGPSQHDYPGHMFPQPGAPWNTPSAHHGTWEHDYPGHVFPQPGAPWNTPSGHRGTWEHGYPRYTPWGHQRTWESSHDYWRHQPGYVFGHPGHMPSGHQRTWGSARDYWRARYGYGGGPDYGRDFWRYAPGHPHHHLPIGKAVLGTLLPFPFNRLLGQAPPREEVQSVPVPEFWQRAPNEYQYDPFRAIWRHASGMEGVRQVVSELQRRFPPDPVREVWRRASGMEGARQVVSELQNRFPAEPMREVVWRDPPVREVVREVVVREPVREIVREPMREYVRPEITLPAVRRDVVVNVDVRPRPLYHLSFGRPMSEHELRRYLTCVPQLRAHPDGVLAEMAGLMGQARDVRGVDATTGEYLLLPGETLADVADKLVGERGRWRELEAANPMRVEGDPRVRIPPSWFGYVPYSIPIERARELRELRREGELEELEEREASNAGDAHEPDDDAGYVRGRYARRGSRRRTFRPYASMSGFRSFARPQPYWGDDPNGGDPYEDTDDADDSSGPRAEATPRRRYRVTHFDALGTPSPTYTRETAEQIVMQHKLFDGHHVLRPDWWAELRGVNPQKPLNADGWWRDIREGESIWIPDFWPLSKAEPGPESAEAAGVWDSLAQFSPFGAPPPADKSTAQTPDDPTADLRVLPEMIISGGATNAGPRQSVTRQTYSVVRGDWPQKIAQRFGAQGRAHWWSELQAANPHKATNRTTGNWTNLYANEAVNIPDAWVSSDTGEEDDSDAGALRQNITQRTYAVVAGDGMQRIAQKLGAASSGSWFSELRDANPHKKMAVNGKGKQVAWESLYPGEILNIPDAWPDTPQLRPAPGGVPTQAPYPGLSQFPALPGGAVPSPTAPPGTVAAAATVDPGTMLRVQAILIAFRQAHPDVIVPRDFGTGMPFSPDATGVLTPRTQQALASFQRWSNATTGSRLRSDGVLDPETIAALDSFSAQAIGGLAQRPPAGPGGGGSAPDPFAGAFAAAGDFVRNLGRGAPPGREAPSDPPPWHAPGGDFDRRPPPPAAPVLNELPGALQQYGIPGVPGLPGGAPHAPRLRRPRVEVPLPPPPPPPPDAQYDDPPEALAPVTKKTSSDEGIVPLVLAGLGLVAGVFV